ncbi:hypothetical protein C7G80_18405, partial [Acinetobacter nosocomialis]
MSRVLSFKSLCNKATSNNTKVRVKTILCGYNKCYGISLDNKEAIIYPPEQTAQPISRIKKLKEAP